MADTNLFKDMTSAEQEVATYLDRLGLKWYFQHPIFLYDERNRPRVWTPDFFLPHLKIHIEVCGSKEFDYEYREQIYKSNEVSIIFIHQFKDKKEWQSWLRKEILEIEDARHGKVMQIVKKIIATSI